MRTCPNCKNRAPASFYPRCRKCGHNLVPGGARPDGVDLDSSAWVGPLEEAADYIAELAKEMEAVGSVAMGCNLHAAEQAMRAALQWVGEPDKSREPDAFITTHKIATE